MNKHRYRIVFNQTRGMLMVVAESARRQGKAGESNGPGGSAPARRAAFGLSALSLGVLLFTGAISWATPLQAQIVADRTAPGNRQAGVLNAANGVLQINIQTPSAAGVSRNVFSQFDVPASGAVLNNSRIGAQTRLGGLVQGNPWLATGTARVIVSEVNATSPSQLRGYVEVGGDRAEVVIANPAGIVCDGCGFINASRSTLTTGTPIIGNDGLTGFRVQTGSIVVQGAGLDTSSSDYTQLIARAVEVNAGIWAQDLRVNTGAADVSADASQANPLPASSPAPAFALDVAALGGMYAHKITLVGSEAGLGMRNAGHLGASAGEVVVTTAGRLENAGQIDSSTRLDIAATGPIGNSGTLLAGTDARLSTPDNISLGGTLIAQGDVSVAATGSTAWIEAGASSFLVAGRQADGSVGTTGTLQLTATGQVDAHGYSLAGNQLQLTGAAVDLRGGQLAARNLLLQASTSGIDLSASHITAQNTLIGTSPGPLSTARATISAQSLHLEGHSLDNTGGELLQFGNDEMRLQLPGELTNHGGRIASNAVTLRLEAATLDNSDGHIEHAGSGSLEIRSQGLNNAAGQILGNSQLDLHSAGPLTNQGGQISSAGALNLSAINIDNTRGSIQSSQGTSRIDSGAFGNSQGQLFAATDLTLAATGLLNPDGSLYAGRNLSLALTGTGTLIHGGTLAAGQDVTVRARSIDASTTSLFAAGLHSDGSLGGSGALTLSADETLAAHGRNLAAGAAALSAASLDLSASQTSARTVDLHASAGLLDTRRATLTAADTLTLRTGGLLDNRQGNLSATRLDLQTGSLDNSNGELLQTGSGTLSLSAGSLDNARGNITSRGAVRIDSGTVDNTLGQLFAATDLTLGAQNVLNPDGSLYAGHNLAVALTGTLIHGGTLAAGQDVTVRARSIDASPAGLFAAGLQSDGSLGGTGALTLSADETLAAHGRNLAAGNAALSAASLDLSASQTSARTVDLHASAGPLDTRRATLTAADTLTLRTGGLLDNRQGKLSATRLDIQAHSLDNTGGELLQFGTDEMRLQLPDKLTNSGGRIASNATTLRLGATTLDNTGGRIEHTGTGSLEIRSQNLAGSGGQILSNGLLDLHSAGLALDAATTRAAQLSISADTFSHQEGQLFQTGTGAGQLTTTDLLDNQRGQIASNGALSLNAGSIDNRAGDILTSGTQNLSARLDTHLDNREGGRLRAGGTLDLGAASVDNSSGELSAGTTMGLAITRTFANVTGLTASTGALTVTTGVLDNTRGNIQSSQASLRIDSGTVDNTRGQLFAATDLTLGAQNILNPDGSLYARHNLALALTGTLTHGGTLVAGQDVIVSATRIDAGATGLFAAGLRSDGSLGDSGALTLSANETLIAHGNNLAAGTATLSAASLDLSASQTTARAVNLQASAGPLDTHRATLSADEALTLRAGNLLDNRQGSLSAARLDIQAHSLDNTGGELLQTGTAEMRLQLPGELTNRDGRIASNASTLRLGASILDNTGGRIEHAGSGSLEIHSEDLAGSGGQILSNGLLDLHSTALVLDAATTRAAQLAITADTFSHRDGQIVQTGAGAGQLNITGQLDNQHGQIASNGALALSAGSIDNRGGDILTSGTQDLSARLATHLDNRDGGRLRADGTLDLGAASADNSGGELGAGVALGITLSHALTNVDGFLVGRSGASVQAGSLDNTRGTLAATLGSASVQIGGTLDNRAGQIGAHQHLAVSAASLDNRAGTLAASSLSIDTGRGTIDNQGGQLVAGGGRDAGQLTLDSGLVDNTGGLIQARGRLALNTHEQALINRETASTGGILGGAALSLHSATLDNSQGYIGSQENLEIRSATVDNTRGGLIGSAGGIDLLADAAHNQGGRLVGAGDLGLTLTAGFNNTAGLVRAGGRLVLDAASVINTRTQGEGLGLEGREVHLRTTQLDNRDGALRADTALSVTSGGLIDNSRGLISSLGLLALTDPATLGQTLAITHTGGTLLAGTRLSVDALRLSGDGQLLSGGDLAVRLNSSFDNHSEIRANGDANFDTSGTLINRATLAAGGTLQLGASALDNHDGGEIRATQVRLAPLNTLTNRGLIDADDTLITSPLVDNLGSGRIYGTQLAIAATTLNNLPEAGLAPVIAARTRLDLGVGNLENRDHALIFSAGDMAIGASLDTRHLASGQAEHLTNASATIEALGQLTLAARRTDNLDAHFSTHTVETAAESHLEYAFNGSPTRYDESAIRITYRFRDDGVRTLNVLATDSDGRTLKGESFSEFRFIRTIQEEQILSADPGRILAGGNLLLSGDSLTNDKSQIVAGGSLSATLGSLSNIAATGLRTSLDVGTATSYWRHERSGTDSQGSSNTAYLPAPGVDSLTLATPLFVQNSSLGSSTPVIPASAPASLTPTAQGAGLARPSPRSQAIIEVAASLSAATPVDSSGLTLAGGTGSTPGATSPIVPAGTPAGTGTGPDTAPAASAVQPAEGSTVALSAPKGMSTSPAAGSTGSLPGATTAGSGAPQMLIRSLAPAATLPDNRLFTLRPEPGALYLVETDPRFTDRRTWLDSGFMLSALSVDAATTQKRLGDGFYEQQRVREQVAQLTGRRFLDGYANDEAQYQNLMRGGLAYAKAWNLIPGVALSAAQMAQLTTDIVWLVDTPVTLTDGSVQHVLAPQVYVRVREGDIDGSGALLSGNRLKLDVADTVLNSGSLAGRQWVDLSADTLSNLGGRISGDSVALNTRLDLANLGGRLEATQALTLSAGRDITVASTTRSSTSAQGSRTQRDRLAGLYVSGGTLTVQAGRDIQFDAAELLNSAPTAAGPAGTTTLVAGRDLNLGTVTESAAQRIVWDGKNQRSEAGTREIGSVIRTQGDLQLIAGQDLNLRAASLTSQAGALQALAGRDLTLTAGQATTQLDEAHQHQAQGFLKRTTVTTRDTFDQSTALATTLSGNTTSVAANQDVRIQGSNVVSSQGTQVSAGRDLSIAAATDTRNETHVYTEKQSGLFSGGGFGITIGTQQQKTKQDTQGGTAAASTIGSTAGDVLLQAGRAYTQAGSDVLTPQGSIDILAQHVDINAARETRRSQTDTQFTQSGLTLALSSPVINAIQTVVQMKDAASATTDSRMQALAAANTGMAAYNAGTAIQQGQGTRINNQDHQIATGKTNPDGTLETRDATVADQTGGTKLSLSVGGSQSRSQVVQNSNQGRGSPVKAGGDVSIVATGAGTASDLTVQGSTLQAGNDIRLTANNAIRLLAGKNTANQDSTNSSASGALGLSVGSDGIGVTLSASGARGMADGKDVTYANSHVEAGRQLILQSGGDTAIQGAVLSAPKITADVGGSLNVESLQDTSAFKSRQQSLGGSVTVGAGASASLSYSQSKIDSDFASVAEQSGLKAGDEGFQVTVKGGTDLRGGVITSTDKAIQDGKNSFQTGATLTTSDIRNQADYRASSVGINLGSSQANDGQFKPMGNSAGLGHDQGHASSTTLAAISGIAGNTTARTGDAETGIQKIFDAGKVQKDVNAQVLITQTFGAQASKVVGDYASKQNTTLKLQAGQTADPAQKQALLDEAAKWDEGGTYRVLAHTVIGGLTGGTGGALGAGTAAYSAERINALTASMPEGVKQAFGAVIASGIGAAVGGTAGAAAGFNEDLNNRQLHPDEAKLIKTKAADYAAKQHISVERAIAELTQQAEQNNDSAWDKRLGSDNSAAQSFLKEIGLGKTMVDPMTNQTYQLFTADAGQRDNHAMFAQYSKSDPLVRAELDLAMNKAYLPKDAQIINTKMTGSDMALNDAARDYANMKAQPAAVQWSMLSELRGTRLEIAEQYAGLSQELKSLLLTPENAQRRTNLINQLSALEQRDAALLSASKLQILDMGAAGTGNPLKQRETFEGMGEALGLAKLSLTGSRVASINGRINLLKGAVEEAKATSAAELAIAQTKIDLNLYRDWPVASDMVQYRVIQLAERATKNPNADTVVLGKYIEGSAKSYEQIAKAQGATYFEFPGKTWSEAELQLGVDKMWTVNKRFLENQTSQGKTFEFTDDPNAAFKNSYTEKEYNYLLNSGHQLTIQRGIYRAIKK